MTGLADLSARRSVVARNPAALVSIVVQVSSPALCQAWAEAAERFSLSLTFLLDVCLTGNVEAIDRMSDGGHELGSLTTGAGESVVRSDGREIRLVVSGPDVKLRAGSFHCQLNVDGQVNGPIVNVAFPSAIQVTHSFDELRSFKPTKLKRRKWVIFLLDADGRDPFVAHRALTQIKELSDSRGSIVATVSSSLARLSHRID